jgi:GMP synthase-like glutamine amidotransferase
VFSENPVLPDIRDIDFLVIMGGSMSVNDEDKFPWLISEKQFIREFIATGKPVLGICLGAQLIASSLGAKVYPNTQKEIGWFPVRGITDLPQSSFHFPASFITLHWHGDTFDLPEGAVLLASSEATKHQAFQYGKKVLAIQFHPEADRKTLEDFCNHFKKELVPGRFIQAETEIVENSAGKLADMNKLMDRVLSYLTM